jgi:hypothetical protein
MVKIAIYPTNVYIHLLARAVCSSWSIAIQYTIKTKLILVNICAVSIMKVNAFQIFAA